MKQFNKRYKTSRAFLLFWTIFIGVGAVWGAACMFIAPDGSLLQMEQMLSYFEVLPFADVLFANYVFPGIALLLVNGVTNLIAAVLLIKNKRLGVELGAAFGVTLMLWITIQFVILPSNWLSTSYFIFGFLQAVTGAVCKVGYEQSMFSFNAEDYTHVGTDKTKVVVYFSRSGYTQKVAYQIADEQGADIVRITTTERTRGNLGFWWCGRFAMHRWGMPLSELPDLSAYEQVTLCFPVWAFGMCSPMIELCKQYNGKLKNVSYAYTHFMSSRLDYITDKADGYLGVKHTAARSFRSQLGTITEIKSRRH